MRLLYGLKIYCGDSTIRVRVGMKDKDQTDVGKDDAEIFVGHVRQLQLQQIVSAQPHKKGSTTHVHAALPRALLHVVIFAHEDPHAGLL